MNIELKEAKERLAELLDEAADGAEIVIERGDGSAFRLVPMLNHRVAGLHEGMIEMGDDFDEPLPDSFWFGRGDPASEEGKP